MRKIGFGKNQVVANVGMLFSGNLLAMVIPFFLAPIITRLYTPADFGSFELFAKILAFFSVVATFRYELAMVLPKKEEKSILLGHIALRYALVFVIILLVLGWSLAGKVAELFNNPSLEGLLPWLGLAVLITAVYAIVLQYGVRTEQFKLLARLKVYATGSNQGAKVLLGYLNPGPLSLVLGHIIGLFVPLLFIKRWFSKVFASFGLKPGAAHRKLAKTYAEFPKANMPHALYDEAEKMLLLLLISYFYGDVRLGLFAFGLRYLRIPVQLLGASIGQVLLPRFAKKINNQEQIRSEIWKLLVTLLIIGLFPFGVLFFYGDAIFSWVLGENWAEAGLYAAIISPWLFINFLASPVSFIPSLKKKQSAFFVLSVVGGILTLAAVFYAAHVGVEFETLLWILSLFMSATMLVKLLWILGLSK